jgi:membrane fusion protein (multidrug efflux system)
MLGAELPGLIREVAFDSGKTVKRGAVLVRLDTTNEVAQLASAVADAELAKATLERARALRKGGANTPVELEAAEARAKQTQAIVANIQATISKKTIRAPFDGRVAMKQVERGQVVSPGTPIATLQSVDPIFAEFSLPQQALADLKTGQTATMRVDSFPGKTWQGTISAVNSEIDSATRNIRVRATFPNKEGILRPGLFVNVDVNASDQRQVLLIPATAVVYAPYGDTVFVLGQKADDQKAGDQKAGDQVKADDHPALVAQPRFVRLGERRGDLVAVVSGLSEGETVVSNGAFKLRKGMSVIVNNTLAPPVELDPKPTDK